MDFKSIFDGVGVSVNIYTSSLVGGRGMSPRWRVISKLISNSIVLTNASDGHKIS